MSVKTANYVYMCPRKDCLVSVGLHVPPTQKPWCYGDTHHHDRGEEMVFDSSTSKKPEPNYEVTTNEVSERKKRITREKKKWGQSSVYIDGLD